MTAGAGAHDEGNLGDHTRCQGIAVENLGIEAQRDHTLLDAGAGAFVNTNERHAGFNGQVHDLDDFFRRKPHRALHRKWPRLAKRRTLYDHQWCRSR